MDWFFPSLIIFTLISLLLYYVLSQLGDKDKNIGQSRNIIYPGSVQTSYPRTKLKPFIPISEIIEEREKAKEKERKESEEPLVPAASQKEKKKKTGVRLHGLTREDIIRSYLIDELLDRKTD